MNIEHSIESAHAARATLALLRPYDVIDARKTRVGRPFDGGYVMIDLFDSVEAAYSLGINDDISWDFEIAQRGIEVFQYDHTIDALPEQNPRFHWEKIGIAASSEGNMRNIPDIIASHAHEELNNIILKCDIECAEWEILPYLPHDVIKKFSQIVIELHDIHRVGDPNDLKVRQALTNLTNFHNVVHVHGNNYGGVSVVGGIALPNVIEVTLLRKDLGQFRPSTHTFPTVMDMPCNNAQADLYLGNFTFS